METQAEERDPFDELASEFVERHRSGDCPTIDEYAERYSDLADEIRELFPTIAAMENVRAGRQGSGSGKARLDGPRLEILGDFRIVREVGRGGMGVVFEAVQESLGKRVAIRVLPRQSLLRGSALKRFEQEARIAAQLHHTNIVPVFGVGEQNGYHYFVMQFVDGVGLDAVIEEHAKKRAQGGPELDAVLRQLGPPDWYGMARVGQQVADALSYAHQQGTLHRDIKPGNLIVDRNSNVWVTDFGLAKSEQSDSLTVSGEISGTLRYMAPEQLSGNASTQSDIYSLGITLYELLTLQPALEETERSSLIQRISQGPPVSSLRQIESSIPRDLETIVLKAVSREPSHRYETAADLASDLGRFIEGRPIRARPITSLERFARWCKRNPVIAALLSLTFSLSVLVAVVAAVGYARTNTALKGLNVQRQKAEANAALATETFDQMFTEFVPARIGLVREARYGEYGMVESGDSGDTLVSRDIATLLEGMLRSYTRLASLTGKEDQYRGKIAEAARQVGCLHLVLGNHKDAAESFRKALDIFESDKTEIENSELMRAIVWNRMGLSYQGNRVADKARDSFLKAHEILEGLHARSPGNVEVAFELASVLLALGKPMIEPAEIARTISTRPNPGHPMDPSSDLAVIEPAHRGTHLNRAVQLCDSLLARSPGDFAVRFLRLRCLWQYSKLTRLKSSLREVAGELADLAGEYPRIIDVHIELLGAYTSDVFLTSLRSTEARSVLLDEATKKLKDVPLQQPHIPRILSARARLEFKLGWELGIHLGQFLEAEQSFRKAIGIQRALADRHPYFLESNIWMAIYCNHLARLVGQRRNTKHAQDLLRESRKATDALLERWPGYRSALMVVVESFRTEADIHFREGRGAEGDRAIDRMHSFERILNEDIDLDL